MRGFVRGLFGRRRLRFSKRYEIINYLVRRQKVDSYLEIGVSRGRCFRKIRCRKKIGVDPRPRVSRRDWDIRVMTSDEFFRSNRERFGLIFIDGLHLAEQVLRDVYHGLEVLEPGGLVLLHDCNPRTEQARRREERKREGTPWNGDVWKAVAYLRAYEPGFFCRVFETDEGVGSCSPGPGGGREGGGPIRPRSTSRR